MNDRNTFSPYTDLALESVKESCLEQEISREKEVFGKSSVTTVIVSGKKGEERSGKPCGTYIAIENPQFASHDPYEDNQIEDLLCGYLKHILPKKKNILVVGLGNRMLTPDALGPRVCELVLASRHLQKTLPEEIVHRLSEVSVFSPGVLGTTGMETQEVLRGLISVVKPSCILAVDALCAASSSRILNTIQLADTGLQPGSGIGNFRSALTKADLGIPVFSIGVPTVVQASSLGCDAFRLIKDALLSNIDVTQPLHWFINQIREEEVSAILQNNGWQNMVVTPSSIDEKVDQASYVVARAINRALHPELNREELLYLQA